MPHSTPHSTPHSGTSTLTLISCIISWTSFIKREFCSKWSFFGVAFLLFDVLSLKFIQVVTCISSSFFFIAMQFFIVHIQFIYFFSCQWTRVVPSFELLWVMLQWIFSFKRAIHTHVFTHFSWVIEFLDHRTQVYLALINAAKQFSKVVVTFSPPQAMQESSLCSAPSSILSAVRSWSFSYLVVSQCGFTLHFPDY